MKIQKEEELVAIIGNFNPWWSGKQIEDLPAWRRSAFNELYRWIVNPPSHRAAFISGARQVGKTTLIMQAIDQLIKSGVPAGDIFYATFDHPILKLAGIDAVIKAWRHREPARNGVEYVFLDEAQFVNDWGTWVKHQVDFAKNRRIIFTGSATPMLDNQESGVGRWHEICITTLSFYEYLRIKNLTLSPLPQIKSLKEIFGWSKSEIQQVISIGEQYIAHFHEYLLRGGFPQTAMVSSITQAQKLIREDIIDKALKRDMTAMFGVRRVLELEHTFLHLCSNDGGMLEMSRLCSNLGVGRPTVQNFIELLAAIHLIHKIKPFGYGKEVLRGKYKIYLADASIAPAVMMKGQSALDNPQALGIMAESSVIKHLFARYYTQNILFSYWQSKKGLEVDLIAEIEGETIPFEVKYRLQHSSLSDCKGLLEFCSERSIKRGYVITRSIDDFEVINQGSNETTILRIPAALLCYFMGEMEVNQKFGR